MQVIIVQAHFNIHAVVSINQKMSREHLISELQILPSPTELQTEYKDLPGLATCLPEKWNVTTVEQYFNFDVPVSYHV